MPRSDIEPDADASPCYAALADQFARSWWMLRDAISRFPDASWYAEPVAGMVPAQRAYHAVYWADAYARRSRNEIANKPDPENADVRALPCRDDLLSYADEVAARIDGLLRGGTDRKLLSAYRTRRTGACLFERLIYVLRHNMQHYGELQTMLRQLGLKPGEWR
jgi:uncharacterized damage-inducible protein DinB